MIPAGYRMTGRETGCIPADVHIVDGGEMKLRLMRVVFFALLTVALTGSALTGQGRRVVEFACPPSWEEPIPGWERFRDQPQDCGFTASCALIAFLFAVLGFALGRATAPPPYDGAGLRREVDRLTGLARADAHARGENYADLALQDLADAIKRAI
jgi:hypothetical protein